MGVMLRIVQVGLGPLGRRVATDLEARGLGRVVAAVDPDDSLMNLALADVLAASESTISIVRDLDDVADWSGVDCAVVTTGSSLPACAPTFRRLLSRSCAVVSSCEELFFPWLRHDALARELDGLAKEHGGRLLGTGVNPGFLMDAFAVCASSVCRSVRAVTVQRVQDAAPRRVPFQRKIGVGLHADEFARRAADGSLRHVGLGESLHFVARSLGLTVSRWEEHVDPLFATEPLDSALGVVEVGQARGVRQVARGYAGDQLVVELDFVAAVGEPDPHDRVVIDGDPPVDLIWRGGVHGDVATSAILLNTIPKLLDAKPGLHTMATIPLPGFAPISG